MTNKWMLGTALAAMLAASPALAQSDANSMSDFGACALDEMNNEEFLGLDLNDDSGLTVEEYRECLAENNVDVSDDRVTVLFDELDTDNDDMIVFAEVETYVADMSGDGEVGEEGAPQGTVTVTQPGADVNVDQPAPDVNVDQPEPDVTVETQQPQVDVQTPEPEVAVEQPAPDVNVEQPEPTVAVEQPDPEVTVEQPQPDVAVDAGQPDVDVEASEPQVAVETPDPEVAVEQPELDVEVQEETPDVAVEQESPDVAVEQTSEVDAEIESEAATTETATEAEATAVETEATQYQIRIDDLEGEDVMNSAGEEIGEIDTILLDPSTNAPVVIISVGGILGIGDKDIAFPYDDLTITGDEVVLNTDMTAEEIEDMDEIDDDNYQDLPETMIIR